ncbi:hypothetical protein V8C44DRAFT_323611 [Trichoderma aethiopicum]
MVIMGLRSFLRFLMLPEPLDVGGRASFLVRSASTSLPLIAADGVCCFRCKRRRRRRRRRKKKEASRKRSKGRERTTESGGEARRMWRDRAERRRRKVEMRQGRG